MPYLYRYEDEKYIDDFFENGNLLLSSFTKYKSYKDNELGDKHEGHAMTFVKGENKKDLGFYSMAGRNDLCFCTSTILENDLKKAFKRNSVFRIVDPLNFILEIDKSLTRVHQVLFGNCIYVDKRILMRRVDKVDIENFKDDNDPDKISLHKILNATKVHSGPDQYFLKLIEHQHQNEYRIIWLSDRKVEDGIILKCKEAIKYCERI